MKKNYKGKYGEGVTGSLCEYMVHECAKDSLGLRKTGMTSMSRRLAVADEVYIVLEFYKRYNIPREL